MIITKLVTAKSKYFSQVVDLRTSVFVLEQNVRKTDEFDNYDKVGADAVFAICIDDDCDKVVATGRLANIYGYYKLSRIAVDKDFRNQNLGTTVVKSLLDFAFNHGVKEVNLWAQTHAVPFYEKIGFKVTGTEFTDLGLPHMPMLIKKCDYVAGE